MSDWVFIAAAYGLAWVVLAVYGAQLVRIRGRARRDFENVRKGVVR